jgi:hypothetical protein
MNCIEIARMGAKIKGIGGKMRSGMQLKGE